MSKVPATRKVTPFQKLLLERLKVLGPLEPGQVFVMEMPQAWFDRKDPGEVAEMKAFGEALGKAAGGADVFLIPEGRLKVASEPPKLPPIQVPKPTIVLPHGVQI